MLLSLATRHSLQLLIAELQGLVRLIPEPIRLTYIKPSLLRQCHSGIKIRSTLKFFLKPSILLELGKQGCELLF